MKSKTEFTLISPAKRRFMNDYCYDTQGLFEYQVVLQIFIQNHFRHDKACVSGRTSCKTNENA